MKYIKSLDEFINEQNDYRIFETEFVKSPDSKEGDLFWSGRHGFAFKVGDELKNVSLAHSGRKLNVFGKHKTDKLFKKVEDPTEEGIFKLEFDNIKGTGGRRGSATVIKNRVKKDYEKKAKFLMQAYNDFEKFKKQMKIG